MENLYDKRWIEVFREQAKEITPSMEWSPVDSDALVATIQNDFLHQNLLKKAVREIRYCANVTEHLVLFSPTPDLKSFPDLDQILTTIRFVNHISRIKLQPYNKIYLVPLDVPKLFNESQFTKENVNSGVCKSFQIVIWRREEMKKVLVHELVHLLKMDFHGCDDELREFVQKSFDLAPGVRIFPNEATTDAIALIIMSFLNGMWMNKDPKQLLEDEVNWTLHQTVHIVRKLPKPWCFEADVLSYYILKGLLLLQVCADEKALKALLSQTIFYPDKLTRRQALHELVSRMMDMKFLNSYYSRLRSVKHRPNTLSLKMSCHST